jgi:hypothetical protein
VVKYSGGGCAPVSGRRSGGGRRVGGRGSSRRRRGAWALTGCSERGRSGGPRWLNDGKHSGAAASKRWRREKGRSIRGGAPFIAGGGGW